MYNWGIERVIDRYWSIFVFFSKFADDKRIEYLSTICNLGFGWRIEVRTQFVRTIGI